MGMFDTIICNYDAGPGFWNRELQTKDLICLMSEYWLSPAGQLFELDLTGTYDWVETNSTSNKLTNPLLVPKPNGNHGRLRVASITKTLEVYPAKWDAHYAPFPRCHFTFVDGILDNVERSTHDKNQLC